MRRNHIMATVATVLAAGMVITEFESSTRFNYVMPTHRTRFNAPKLRGAIASNRLSQKGRRRRARQAGVKVK